MHLCSPTLAKIMGFIRLLAQNLMFYMCLTTGAHETHDFYECFSTRAHKTNGFYECRFLRVFERPSLQ